MGIIFVKFAELWVRFFQTCTDLWAQIFLTKMARPRSKLGLVNPPTPWAVGCRVVSRCIVLEERLAVADEIGNELYNCNDLCSLAGILYGIQLKS